jgi:fido (protein-threonine AMPylation protein)
MNYTRKKNEDRLRTSCASAEEGREEILKKEEASNNQFNLIIPFVMKIAVVASLLCGNFHANPLRGAGLQVKQVLYALIVIVLPIVSNDTIIDYMKPPYEITPKILKLYGRINEAIGQCKSLNLVRPEARLRKQNRIKTIHSSLAIEGNTLSVDQVTAIIENNRVAGPKKDIIEVQNAIKAYDVLNSLKTLKMSDYLKSHKVLMDGLIASPGKFRTKQVAIVKGKNLQHVAPKYDMVAGLMKDLFDYLKTDHDLPIIKSCVFHYESEFIHPFEDGNGRMGRLWQIRILMDENPIFEYVRCYNLKLLLYMVIMHY